MRTPLLTFTFLTSVSFAITVTPGTIEKQLKEADLVADIEVLSQTVESHPAFGALTLTQVEVQTIHRRHLDDHRTGDTLLLLTPGGEKGGRGTMFPGIPKPYLSHRYRAHLRRANGFSSPAYEIAGFEQGLIELDRGRKASRNRTDGSNGQGNGAFLFWDSRFLPIPYFIAGKSFDGKPNFVTAIDTSFKSWRDIADVKVEFLAMGCSSATQNENDGINNIILINSNWGFDTAAIAITRNFYVADQSERAGLILDTDILLNDVDHEFTTTNKTGAHDVQNILTHEIGHFLGLGHEVNPQDTSATMYAVASPNETLKRTLKTSDLSGIREAYPGVTDKFYPPVTRCDIRTNAKGCSSVHDGDLNGAGDRMDGFSFLFVLALITATIKAARFTARYK